MAACCFDFLPPEVMATILENMPDVSTLVNFIHATRYGWTVFNDGLSGWRILDSVILTEHPKDTVALIRHSAELDSRVDDWTHESLEAFTTVNLQRPSVQKPDWAPTLIAENALRHAFQRPTLSMVEDAMKKELEEEIQPGQTLYASAKKQGARCFSAYDMMTAIQRVNAHIKRLVAYDRILMSSRERSYFIFSMTMDEDDREYPTGCSEIQRATRALWRWEVHAQVSLIQRKLSAKVLVPFSAEKCAILKAYVEFLDPSKERSPKLQEGYDKVAKITLQIYEEWKQYWRKYQTVWATESRDSGDKSVNVRESHSRQVEQVCQMFTEAWEAASEFDMGSIDKDVITSWEADCRTLIFTPRNRHRGNPLFARGWSIYKTLGLAAEKYFSHASAIDPGRFQVEQEEGRKYKLVCDNTLSGWEVQKEEFEKVYMYKTSGDGRTVHSYHPYSPHLFSRRVSRL
ncbi:hypothetical protein ED733_006103 [Metarhizium rileyi]|uniref:F-box domain-containing protein n=1 Tax=Metarhizium rileyi (strain RCEF 4871) TaxID=1649241 RepID=A0A5C6GB76_METRR|nr:hypothetical protein ED733_006103 [Metarhizium rileyi]